MTTINITSRSRNDMFKTYDNLQKFRVTYADQIAQVTELALSLRGKSVDTAKQDFKSKGFWVTSREDGICGEDPFFDPTHVYVYYKPDSRQVVSVGYVDSIQVGDGTTDG